MNTAKSMIKDVVIFLLGCAFCYQYGINKVNQTMLTEFESRVAEQDSIILIYWHR